MEPLFFGEDARIFGAYYPGVGSKAALIISPLMTESLRAHPVLREVSESLSRRGFHVLRVELSGSGNSTCEPMDVSAGAWRADLNCSVEELRSLSGVNSILCIAARFCVRLALNSEYEFQRIVAWDPLFSGSDWLSDMEACRKLLTEDCPGVRVQSEYYGHKLKGELLKEIATTSPETIPAHMQVVQSDTNDRWVTAHLPQIYSPLVVGNICQAL